MSDIAQNLFSDTENEVLLMCKDVPVYSISKKLILNETLVPGCIIRGTMNFDEWLRTRYSIGSNTSARRLMLRAFAADSHNEDTVKATRALSLSDCYWVKDANKNVLFNDVTPYLNNEWDGNGAYNGGSISTLFVNGAANKKWVNADTLLKYDSFKEAEPYELCSKIGIYHVAKTHLSDKGLLVSNFTSTSCFLESMEQSGHVNKGENAREKAVEIFEDHAVTLFVIDFLVEHDDRHWGNYGFLRDADTGKYLGMSPYYDFDWVWTNGVIPLPKNAISKYGELIADICYKAKAVSTEFTQGNIIRKRADELLDMISADELIACNNAFKTG